MDPQLKGIIDRGIAVLATMLLGKLVKLGWLGQSEVAELSPIIIVLVPAAVWAWYDNRSKALLQKAATVTGVDGKKTVVIAPPELANATVETNIISTGASQFAINEAIATSVTTPRG